MNRFMLALVVALCAAPAFAASPANCDKFVAAFDKAGKAATGKSLEASDKDFWKKACLKDKEKDANIEKQTRCLDGAKTKDEFGACMK